MSVRELVARRRGVVGFVAGLAVAGVVAGGTFAFAAIPATTTATFTACVSKTSGAARVIDYQAGKRCTTAERTITWAKGYRYRGTWSSATAYAAQDVVLVGGSSYVAKRSSTGSSPAGSASWGLLAAGGAAGAAGPAGAPGPAGPTGPTGAPGPGFIQGTSSSLSVTVGSAQVAFTTTVGSVDTCGVQASVTTGNIGGWVVGNALSAYAPLSDTFSLGASVGSAGPAQFRLTDTTGTTITLDWWSRSTLAGACTSSWRYQLS